MWVNNAFWDTVPYCECGLGFEGSKQDANTTLLAPGAPAHGDDWFCHRGAPSWAHSFRAQFFRAHSFRARHCNNVLANLKVIEWNANTERACQFEGHWMGCKYELWILKSMISRISVFEKVQSTEEALMMDGYIGRPAEQDISYH